METEDYNQISQSLNHFATKANRAAELKEKQETAIATARQEGDELIVNREKQKEREYEDGEVGLTRVIKPKDDWGTKLKFLRQLERLGTMTKMNS